MKFLNKIVSKVAELSAAKLLAYFLVLVSGYTTPLIIFLSKEINISVGFFISISLTFMLIIPMIYIMWVKSTNNSEFKSGDTVQLKILSNVPNNKLSFLSWNPITKKAKCLDAGGIEKSYHIQSLKTYNTGGDIEAYKLY